MAFEKMQRVNKHNLCPICQHGDWCLIAEDKAAAICQRVEEGAVKRCGDAGWLHILHDDRRNRPRSFSRRIRVTASGNQTTDFEQLAEKYQGQLTTERLNGLSALLGVSAQSLERLHVGWDRKAHTFPMSDAEGRIIGVRRRFPSGKKISVKGSRSGLFIPDGLSGKGPLLITEGESDLAAALDLGFDAIGRPSCNSKINMTARAARGRAEIVIVGDTDEVGRAGAEKLADALALHYPCVKVVYPLDGCKDLRAWVQRGLTCETLQQIIDVTKPVRIEIGRSMEAYKHEGN